MKAIKLDVTEECLQPAQPPAYTARNVGNQALNDEAPGPARSRLYFFARQKYHKAMIKLTLSAIIL
jgi:hypothetical protein